MKKTLYAAASMLSLAVVTSHIDAQGVTRRESRGEVRNRVTVNTVTAAMDNTSRVISRLNTLGNLTDDRVRVIDVRPYVAPAGRSSYLAALNRNGDRIEQLRAELVAMDPVVRVLAKRRPALTVDDVVGAGILDVIETGKSAGVLVLYVDNRNRLPRAENTDGRNLATFRPTPASLIASLNATPEMVARVSALQNLRLDRMHFFDIDAILTPAQLDDFRGAVRNNETAIRSLRAELSKRPVVLDALARSGLSLGSVFAADIIGSGDVLVLYYRRNK